MPRDLFASPAAPVAKQPRDLFAAPEQPSTLVDVAKSGMAGLRTGIEGIVGMFGDAGQAQGNIAGWAAEKLGASPETQETVRGVASKITPFPMALPTEKIQGMTNPVVGEPYEPQTTAGEYARTIGEFAPAAVAGPGGMGRRLVTQALLPAVGSETAGQMTEGTSAEPYARIAGALAGGLAPSAAGRAISPVRASPERLQMADTLANEGVDLTAGQRTGSNTLRYMESELGGMAGQRIMEQQGEQFTNAAMQRAGASGRATPDNMASLRDRLGSGFDDISARSTLKADAQLSTEFSGAVNKYLNVLPSEQKRIITANAQDIIDKFKAGKGALSGEDYQTIRSRLGNHAKNASDNDMKEAWRGMRNALDDAMGRSVSPDDAATWKQLRREYGNMKTLERAATGAGENAAMGLVSPAQLRTAATTGRRGQYARGEGDFDELARAGEGVMKPLPNSGTAGRLNARMGGAGISGVIGALLGNGAMPGVGTIAGGIAGAAVPSAIGRAILSRPGRAYLGNQLANALPTNDPRTAAIIAALMANQGRPALSPPSP